MKLVPSPKSQVKVVIFGAPGVLLYWELLTNDAVKGSQVSITCDAKSASIEFVSTTIVTNVVSLVLHAFGFFTINLTL